MDIKLREIELDDIEMVRNWRNSPDVSKYMYTDTIISKENQKSWFNKIIKDESCKYWIISYDNKSIGLVSVTGIDKALQSCYWAFYLGDSSIRGAGIGSKVEYNVIEYVFNELSLNKLRCEVFVTNDNVIKMHEKFGFRREAFYREHCVKKDKKIDVVGLALLKSDWEKYKGVFRKKIYS
jgi:UDP-4-amino-4,6-dideoxy-N-acetyl-beta-L-altrosamine N-acetyltransferase